MGFFVKKIDNDRTRDFFISVYSDITSKEEIESNKDKLKQVSEKYPLLKSVTQKDFDKHLTAINMELAEISWSKYMVNKVGFEGSMDYITKIKPQIRAGFPEIKKYEDLMGNYNQAFASGTYNGFATMAEYFVSHLLPDYETKSKSKSEEVGDLTSVITDLIAGSYSVINELVEHAGLIS